MGQTYYDEFDGHAAKWLRNLMDAGLISPGVVDERSIVDVQADELVGFDRVHMFAGIGGWDLALQFAGWDPAEPVWTGSCPCQPFALGGKRRLEADPRHLWPEFRRLIGERRPPAVFGEQTANRFGREWLAGVRVDLEALGYAVGAADLCAAGVGAPHIRQRLFWVAGRMGDSAGSRLEERQGQPGDDGAQLQASFGSGSALDAWSRSEVLRCLDGRSRRVGSGVFPLAPGIPGRVGQLRGYGNAIVPQLAATFIKAFMETRADRS